MLASILAGYNRQLTLGEAETLIKPAADYYEKLRASGSEAAAALELFSSWLVYVVMCDLPIAGLVVAAYVGYSVGVLSKAFEVHPVVLTEDVLLSSTSSVLLLAALTLAAAEGLYLSVIMLRKREQWEPLETAALVLLQASLVALASILGAAAILG
jgi:hypothetical protein